MLHYTLIIQHYYTTPPIFNNTTEEPPHESSIAQLVIIPPEKPQANQPKKRHLLQSRNFPTLPRAHAQISLEISHETGAAQCLHNKSVRFHTSLVRLCERERGIQPCFRRPQLTRRDKNTAAAAAAAPTDRHRSRKETKEKLHNRALCAASLVLAFRPEHWPGSNQNPHHHPPA